MSIQQIKENFYSNIHKYIATKVEDLHEQDSLSNSLFQSVNDNLPGWSESRKFSGWLHSQFSETIASDSNISGAKIAQPLYDARSNLSILIKPIIELTPETYQQVLLLSEVEGRTQKEISQETGLTLTAVKEILHKGRILMKQILTQCFLVV